MPPGLKDVAKRAGVSMKTVSNVVNGYVHVSAHTRAKVQDAIDELGYRPNVAARHLRSGRSGVIALALPELQLPYFAELAGLIVQAAEERSWTVLIDQTDGHADRERMLVSGLRRHSIDGLIFSPLALAGEELARGSDDTPMVLLGERVWYGPADHVAIDNTAAAADATRHLTGIGRRRIAAIGAQDRPSGVTAQQRLAGYRAALDEAGHRYDPAFVAEVEQFHRADGAAAMARLLDAGDPPDAVFCFNDLLALGAMRTLLDRGYAVPGDVAVVGFDDIEDGRFSTPTLTTVSPDTARIARLAVDLLAERLGEPTPAGDPALPADDPDAALPVGGPALPREAGQASPGQTSAGQASAEQASPGQVSAGQASAGQTSPGQMSAGQMSAGQMSAGQMSAGQASAGLIGDVVVGPFGGMTGGPPREIKVGHRLVARESTLGRLGVRAATR